MRTLIVGKPPSNQNGFSYVMVLAAIVIVGIVAEAAHVTTWRVLQADREAELFFRGRAYQKAIQSFYQSNGAFPRSLEDLQRDPRSANKRHIRNLYTDPMSKSNKSEWILIRSSDGGITGVTSASNDEPLKQANFPTGFEKFNGAKSYSEWIFEYTPAVRNRNAVAPPITAPVGTVPLKVF